MASYADLFSAIDSVLLNRVEVATLTAAYNVLTEAAPSESRVAWARGVIDNPAKATDSMAKMIVVKTQQDNPSVAVEGIRSAADEAIQPAVNDMVALLAGV